MPYVLVLAVLLAAGVLAGRTLVGVIGFRPLLRFTPANAASSAVLGLATVTVLYAWLTAAGFAAPRIVVALVLLHAVALGFVGRNRVRDLWRPRGSFRHWLSLGGVAATAAVIALLPALRDSFAVDNDTHTYCAFSEWLQGHGFGSRTAWDPESPVTYFPDLWQRLGATLGASYPLALAQAATRAPAALVVYPVVSAWGLVLGALAVIGVARSVLGLSATFAFLAGGLFAVIPSPDYWAHHQGFLQQTLALPVLLLSVALVSRPGALARSGAGGAALIALLLAFLLLVYLPFVPFFLAASLSATLVALRRSRRAHPRRVFGWLFLSALLALVFSLGSALRAGAQIGAMALAVPGSHIGLTPFEFVELALGARIPGGEGIRLAAVVLLALTLAGLPRLARRPRVGSTAAVLALLAAAVGYFAFMAEDPWTGTRGHTWSLFKLIQWAYPFVLLLQVAGLSRLLHRARVPERMVLAPLAFVALILLSVHWVWSWSLGRSLRMIYALDRPLAALGGARARLLALPGGPLLVLNRPGDVDRWLGIYAALAVYPRRIVADWEGSVDVRADFGAEPWRKHLPMLGRDEGPVPVILGPSPWGRGGLVALGAGFWRVEDLEPRLVQLRNPDELGDDSRLWLGRGRTKVAAFAARPVAASLVLVVGEKPPAEIGMVVLGPAFAGQPLRAGLAAAPERVIAVAPERDAEGPYSIVRLPLALLPGLTRVVLRVPGATTPRAVPLHGARLLVR